MDGSVATSISGHKGRHTTPGIKVVIILGATATGKSALAMDVARRFAGEIVSADSRYLYRGMDIGTAKPTPDELAEVVHHLVNVAEPGDDFSLAVWLERAFDAIESVSKRHHLPVVAGGTPLYLRALLEGWTVPAVAPDPALRERLEKLDAATLHAMVSEIDPASASKIGATNKRRLIRAYEVFEIAGVPMSRLESKQPPPYDILILGLQQEREQLYQRIDRRVRWMFANGILDEASRLIAGNVPMNAPAMSAIGYREAVAVVNGDIGIDDGIERTCLATHRYVRHQETWFRRFSDVRWIDSSDTGFSDLALGFVEEFLSGQESATG